MSTTQDSREQFYVVLALDEYEDTNLLATCKHYSLIVCAVFDRVLLLSAGLLTRYNQGLDTEAPVLKIDDLIFKGTYEESVGTELLFEQHSMLM
jgi:hypothetical protein